MWQIFEMNDVGFFENRLDFLAVSVVAFVRLGDFQNKVWICLLFFKDDFARPGVDAERVPGDEVIAAFCD